jgi:hypothetical protein
MNQFELQNHPRCNKCDCWTDYCKCVCVVCNNKLVKHILDYGRNHMAYCNNCDKYLIKDRMYTKKEIGF